jgi:hypothetical protein
MTSYIRNENGILTVTSNKITQIAQIAQITQKKAKQEMT